MIQLQQLFPQWQGDLVILTGLTTDSRQVKPGYLFLALPGLRHDGRDHVDQAVAAGAAAVAYEAADGFTCRAAVPVLPIGHWPASCRPLPAASMASLPAR